MGRLCSLKEITPGSVVELPKELQGDEKNAILFGLEYNPDKTKIMPQFIRRGPNSEFLRVASNVVSGDQQIEVQEDKALSQALLSAFVQHKLEIPDLGLSAGCDPEIFVIHEDGTVFPAWEFLPGEEEAVLKSKEWLLKSWVNRESLNGIEHSGAQWALTDDNVIPRKVPAYWDGVQAEFTPWAKCCLETLHMGTREGLAHVLSLARAKDPKAKLTLQNVIQIPDAILKGADDKHIQFRCTQSYNIYNDPGDGIQNPRDYIWRASGGHIHLGFTRRFTAPTIEQIVRGLDGVLGVIGVSLAAGIDNPERRRTYGRAGEFRLPDHGIEYRVLSNFWLCHPAVAMLVFDLARAVVRFARSGLYNVCWSAPEAKIRDVINNCDVNGAREIIRANSGVLMGILYSLWDGKPEYARDRMRKLAAKAIMNSIASVIPDPWDIEKNWKLGDESSFKNHCRGRGDSWQSLATEVVTDADLQ